MVGTGITGQRSEWFSADPVPQPQAHTLGTVRKHRPYPPTATEAPLALCPSIQAGAVGVLAGLQLELTAASRDSLCGTSCT